MLLYCYLLYKKAFICGCILMCSPYRDDHLGSTELTVKLEPAFLSGLRCPVVQIRSKFFAIFDSSVQKRIFDRLLYIMCSQNWEQCAGYFWIKHCLEVS